MTKILQRSAAAFSVSTDSQDRSALFEKWGTEALRPGFVVVPWVLLRRQQELGLEVLEVLVLTHLIGSWWDANLAPYPRSKTIANRLGVSVRTVQRSLSGLEQKGFLRRTRGVASNGETIVVKYDLTPLVQKLTDHVTGEIKKANEAKNTSLAG